MVTLVILLILLSLIFLTSPIAAFPSYFAHFAPFWIAIDSDQNVWVTGPGMAVEPPGSFHGVTKLNQRGEIIGIYTALPRPLNIAADRQGFVYVLDGISGDVAKLNASTLRAEWTKTINPDGIHIALDSHGNVWVISYTRNTLVKASNNGNILGTFFPSTGCCLKGLAVDSHDNVWLGSYPSYVFKFNNMGTQTGLYTGDFDPWNVAIDSMDNVWIASYGTQSVTKLSNDGNLITVMQTIGTPWGLDLDQGGELWVSINDYPSRGNQVQRFNASGYLVQTYTVGLGPVGVKIDDFGNAWVANHRDSSVTKIDRNMSFIPTPAPTLVPTPAQSPPSSFILVPIRMPWTAADSYCRRKFGTRLATVNSAGKQQFLNTAMRNKSAHWIGIRYSYTEREFIWRSKDNSTFLNWDQRLVNIGGLGLCGKVTRAGFWRVGRCGKAKRFWCDETPL